MWTWLTSPPVLLTGLAASILAILQALRTLIRKITLFPRLAVELAIGHWFLHALISGKTTRPPDFDPDRYPA
jgi:hypothetical protein